MARRPSHPGETLLNFLAACEASQNALARRMGVPPRRINEIVLGKRSISADTAIGLAEAFGTTELFWMRLQADYDLGVARAKRGPRRPMPHWHVLGGGGPVLEEPIEIDWRERVRVSMSK